MTACRPGEGVSPFGNGAQKAPPAGTKFTCAVKLDPPRVTTQMPSKKKVIIIGVATSVCAVPPVTHVMQVGLKHSVERGGWQPMPDVNGQTTNTCRDLPTTAKPRVQCVAMVPCVLPGTYRTEVLITGTDPNGRDYTVPVPPSASSKITC
jgi:hypothetical protein